jgi:hypothetical protein
MEPVKSIDARSALVLVEPVFHQDGIRWHGMAFLGGKCVDNVTGVARDTVYDDCVCALAAAHEGFDSDGHMTEVGRLRQEVERLRAEVEYLTTGEDPKTGKQE